MLTVFLVVVTVRLNITCGAVRSYLMRSCLPCPSTSDFPQSQSYHFQFDVYLSKIKMRICTYCRTNVLATTKPWGEHKKSLEELRNAASQKCVFCSQLLGDLGHEASRFSKGDWPMYQWHKRTLGGTRESKVPTVITFSGVTPKLPREEGQSKEERARIAQEVVREGHVYKQRRFYSYLREGTFMALRPSLNAMQAVDVHVKQISMTCRQRMTSHLRRALRIPVPRS